MKKEITPEFLWHIDKVALTFQTTIITTVDARGRINAAPFGLVYPFSTGSDNPQMLAGINSQWHTAQNILATKEFTINYAPYSLLKQVAVTGRLFDEGVNELEKAGLTAMPAVRAASRSASLAATNPVPKTTAGAAACHKRQVFGLVPSSSAL